MPFLAGRGQSSRGYFGGGTVPDAPTGLSSVPSNSQLTVSFTPPAFDGGLAITNYEYSINAGSTWMAISPADTTSPVAITGLTNGTTYTVYLRAVNPLGSGASSIALSTGTTPFTGPTAPTLLSSTPGNTQLAISFTAPSDNGGFAITNYEYALSTNSGTSYGSWTALSPTDAISPVTIPGLTNGTAYWVKLRAITSAAIGTESDPATTNTMPFTTPTAPTSLSSTAGNTQLAIAFTAPTSSGGPPITNYEYALSTNSGGSYASWVALSPADALTPVTITGLINGTAYYVKLRASTDFAKGAESLAVTTNTMPFTAPAPPTGLASSAGDGQLYISFTAGSSGGPPITNYQYALSTNSGSTYSAFTALSPADATSPITISGLTNGQAYYVKLRTVTSLSTSLDSDAVFTNTTPYTGPTAPTGLVSTPGNTSLSIAFTAPTSNGGFGITNYEYALSTNSGTSYGSWTAFSPADTTSPVSITGLTNGTAYYVKLRAITSAPATGAESVAVTTGTTPRTVPSITLNSATNFNQDRATLNATVTSDGGSAITSVSFQYYKGGDAWTSATGVSGVSNTWYANISSLAVGTVYTFRVNATNAAGTTTTSTTTFTTWSLKPALLSTTNSSLTIPTITPTGGSRINPSIHEVVIFGGGGTRGTYGSAGGGAAYKSDASVEVTQGSGVVSWTIGGTGGGNTTVSGLSVTYSAAGGGNGSSETPVGPSAYVGGDGWGAMTSGGSGGSGNGNGAGAGRYYAEDKIEQYAYGGGGGSNSAGGNATDGYATNPSIAGNGGLGNSFYGIEGGGGGGGSGSDFYGIVNGTDGTYRTYGGGESGSGASAATSGVVRFKYYGA